MGMNYSTRPTCGQACGLGVVPGLHIGKASAGWRFGLHVIPERGLTSWPAWLTFLAAYEVVIVDENGARVELSELVAIVEAKGGTRLVPGEFC